SGTPGAPDFNDATAYYSGSLGKWYFRTSLQTNWTAAQNEAWRAGGNLVSIANDADNTTLTNKFGTNFWLGYYLPPGSTTWRSTSRTNSNYQNWPLGVSNASPAHLFGYMDSNGSWAVTNNTASKYGVVEIQDQRIDLHSLTLNITHPDSAV